MFSEEFEIWLTNPFSNIILLTFGMYIINQSYLNNVLLYFTKLLDCNTEELNGNVLGLDNTATIPDNNKEQLPDLFDLEVKQIKKKEEKA